MTNIELTIEEKRISKELYQLSKQFKSEGLKNYHNKARSEINKKYGKGWREDLKMKIIDRKGDFEIGHF